MTITTPDVLEVVDGTGSIITQAVPGFFYKDSDIRVYRISETDGAKTEVLLSAGVDYTIFKSLVAGSRPAHYTGSITTVEVLTSEQSLAVMVWPINEQLTDFSAIPHDPADFEKQHDLAALRDQAILEILKRTVRLPLSSDAQQPVLPGAGKVLMMSADGLRVIGAQPSFTGETIKSFFAVRDVTSVLAAVSLGSGSIVSIAGLLYIVNDLAVGAMSATNDLDVDGLEPFGTAYLGHFGGGDVYGVTPVQNSAALAAMKVYIGRDGAGVVEGHVTLAENFVMDVPSQHWEMSNAVLHGSVVVAATEITIEHPIYDSEGAPHNDWALAFFRNQRSAKHKIRARGKWAIIAAPSFFAGSQVVELEMSVTTTNGTNAAGDAAGTIAVGHAISGNVNGDALALANRPVNPLAGLDIGEIQSGGSGYPDGDYLCMFEPISKRVSGRLTVSGGTVTRCVILNGGEGNTRNDILTIDPTKVAKFGDDKADAFDNLMGVGSGFQWRSGHTLDDVDALLTPSDPTPPRKTWLNGGDFKSDVRDTQLTAIYSKGGNNDRIEPYAEACFTSPYNLPYVIFNGSNRKVFNAYIVTNGGASNQIPAGSRIIECKGQGCDIIQARRITMDGIEEADLRAALPRGNMLSRHELVVEVDDLSVMRDVDISVSGTNSNFNTRGQDFSAKSGTWYSRDSGTSSTAAFIDYYVRQGNMTDQRGVQETVFGTTDGNTASWPREEGWAFKSGVRAKGNQGALEYYMQAYDKDADVWDEKLLVNEDGVSVNGFLVITGQGSAVDDLTITATTGSLPTDDGTVTFADAAAPTNIELLEAFVELQAKFSELKSQLETVGTIAS